MVKRVACYTLGCKVNQQDSDGVLQLFSEAGYEKVDFKEQADVYIINTCTVTHLGDRKSRQMIRRAIGENSQAKIVVTGCYAQTSPGDILAIPGVDLVIGTKDRQKIVQLVEGIKKGDQPLNMVGKAVDNKEFEELPVPSDSRTRAFIKVQEGCNQFCTYCIVPYARGSIRSRPLVNVVEEVGQLVSRGYKEVVLSGTHIGMYGRDQEGKQANLAQLIGALVEIKGLERLRISSVDPNDFTQELIQILTESSVVCPHFHLPLQSGDDQILQRMKRPYTVDYYRELVDRLRKKDPLAAFTTDVMVGFPGETEEQFQNTVSLIKEISFSDLHVFKYSPRKGTPAATFPNQIPAEVKEERSQYLLEMTKMLQEQYASNFINKVGKVLLEKTWQWDKGKKQADVELLQLELKDEKEQTYWEGLTDNYLRVVFPGSSSLERAVFDVQLLYWRPEGFMSGRLIE